MKMKFFHKQNLEDQMTLRRKDLDLTNHHCELCLLDCVDPVEEEFPLPGAALSMKSKKNKSKDAAPMLSPKEAEKPKNKSPTVSSWPHERSNKETPSLEHSEKLCLTVCTTNKHQIKEVTSKLASKCKSNMETLGNKALSPKALSLVEITPVKKAGSQSTQNCQVEADVDILSPSPEPLIDELAQELEIATDAILSLSNNEKQ